MQFRVTCHNEGIEWYKKRTIIIYCSLLPLIYSAREGKVELSTKREKGAVPPQIKIS